MLNPSVTAQYDTDILKEAFNIFIEDSKSTVEKMVNAEGDDLRRLSHRLKGGCLMIGAESCAEKAELLENCFDDNLMQKRFEALKLEHSKLIAYLLD